MKSSWVYLCRTSNTKGVDWISLKWGHVTFSLKLSQVSFIIEMIFEVWHTVCSEAQLLEKKKTPLMIDIHNHLLVFYILNEYELNNSD